MVKAAPDTATVLDPERLAEILRVITEAGPGLRKAGFTRVTIGAIDAYIEPPLPEIVPRSKTDAEREMDDFLDASKYKRRDDDKPDERDLGGH